MAPKRKKSKKGMEKTAKDREMSPDITLAPAKKPEGVVKRTAGRPRKKSLVKTETIDIDSKNDGKEQFLEESSSSLDNENGNAEVNPSPDPLSVLQQLIPTPQAPPKRRRGRPKKQPTIQNPPDSGNDTQSPKLITEVIQQSPTTLTEDESQTPHASSVDVDVTDTLVKKEGEDIEVDEPKKELEDNEPKEQFQSPIKQEPSSDPPPNTSTISPDIPMFIVPMLTPTEEEETTTYDPNFIPGLDLLSGGNESENIDDTSALVVRSLFQKEDEEQKKAELLLVSNMARAMIEQKPETPSPAKDEDSSKIRRSSRIKKLETRRGSARRREVVFSDRDSGCSNLSRSSSVASLSALDEDSNSSGISHFSSLSNATSLGYEADSPPGGEGSTFSTTSNPNSSYSGSSGSSLKLKSRWIDAESSKSNSFSEEFNEQQPSSSSYAEQRQRPEFKVSQNLIKRPGHIIHEADDLELIEKLSKFDGIEENLFRTVRKMSRDRGGMVCDCYLTQDDILRGEIGCNEDCLNRLLMVECDSRCPVGDSCTNKKFQRKEYCRLEVFKTDKKGHGLRTLQPLSEGGFVMEYVGEVLDPREFKHRTKEYAKSNHEHFYFMALKSDAIIDATQRGNCSRFINHSCEPNCETQKWTVNGELRIGFFAIRDLERGEEITFDYQFQRYGKKAQQCFCLTPSCRGWIGGENEETQTSEPDRTKEPSEPGKVRTKAEKKRKKGAVLEDIAFEEELANLERTGLMNKNHTLTLCRLMVRAEDWDDRERILNILINGEKPCRRLFLDYHGLRLLWAWMYDLPLPSPDVETQAIRSDCYHLLLLKALSLLPIPNKSLLQDSKVLLMVEKWSAALPTSKFIVKKVKPEISEATSSDSLPAVVPETGQPGSSESSANSQMPEPESTTISPTDPSSVKVESSSQPDDSSSLTSSSESSLSQVPSSSSLGDGNTQEESTTTVTPPIVELVDYVEELSWGFVETAKEVLLSWGGLQEVFRIPKKERVEQMKEHEREADIWDEDENEKSYDRERDRNYSRSTRDRRHRGDRDRDRDTRDGRRFDRSRDFDKYERQQTARSSGPYSHLSKEQRRTIFAQEVAQKEQEERNRRMQEEMVALHQHRCAHLGLDATTCPIVDPSCTYYLEPTTVTWKPISLDDPSLPQEVLMIIHSSQYPPPEENFEMMTPEPEFVFPPWPEGLLPPPPLPPTVLPPAWKMSVDDEGRCYYYHIRTRITQWFPPTPDSSGAFSDDSSESGTESEEDGIDGEGSGEEIKLPMSEQAQACLKFNASKGNERSEKRKKSGLVQERIISPRNEDDRPLISQKSIRARKVQLMEQKIQEAKEAESRGMGLALSSSRSSVSPGAIVSSLSLDSTISQETKETNGKGLPDPQTQRRSRRRDKEHRRKKEECDGGGVVEGGQILMTKSHRKSTKSQLLPETEMGPPSVESNSDFSLDNPLMDPATSINPGEEEGESGIPSFSSDFPNPVEPEGIVGDTTTTGGEGSSASAVNISSREREAAKTMNAKKLAERLRKISEKKRSHKRARSSGSGKKRGGSPEGEVAKTSTAAGVGGVEKKVKGANMDDFRSQIANVVVQFLNPYRKPSCKAGHIATTEDFKHLARKMTHTIMLKELKHGRAGKPLVVSDNVKLKMKEFVKKYMGKYGERSYARSPDETTTHSSTQPLS